MSSSQVFVDTKPTKEAHKAPGRKARRRDQPRTKAGRHSHRHGGTGAATETDQSRGSKRCGTLRTPLSARRGKHPRNFLIHPTAKLDEIRRWTRPAAVLIHSLPLSPDGKPFDLVFREVAHQHVAQLDVVAVHLLQSRLRTPARKKRQQQTNAGRPTDPAEGKKTQAGIEDNRIRQAQSRSGTPRDSSTRPTDTTQEGDRTQAPRKASNERSAARVPCYVDALCGSKNHEKDPPRRFPKKTAAQQAGSIFFYLRQNHHDCAEPSPDEKQTGWRTRPVTVYEIDVCDEHGQQRRPE